MYDPDDKNFIPVLDHGFCYLVDVMGTDSSITQAARLSYGAGTKSVREDRGLIRYLFRHRHTSPIEMCEVKFHMRLPIFVMRQLIRHRTACLAGDVRLTFDLPNRIAKDGRGAYYLSVKDVYDKFHQPVISVAANFGVHVRRDRVQAMMLRSCDEDVLLPGHTKIIDIWESGIKRIIRVEFSDGNVLRATADHRCLTDEGWLPLKQALDQRTKFATFKAASGFLSEPVLFTEEELSNEEWRSIPIPEYQEVYEVSSLGRVRSRSNFRWGLRTEPRIKELTVTEQGYHIVSLSNGGISRRFFVHRLVLLAFKQIDTTDHTRHLDNNRLNNRVINLAIGSPQQNAEDRMLTGCDQKLCLTFASPIDWRNDGEEMTYDLSVEGPYHNFSAGNVVVHNCVNEYSARYSIISDEFYMPEPDIIQPQSTGNRQGRDGQLSEVSTAGVQWLMQTINEMSYDIYRVLLGERTGRDTDYPEELIYDPYSGDAPLLDPEFPGIARELARTVLPVSYYTEVYWKIDLKNLFDMLKLRTDAHAQYEIRVFAEAMYALIKPRFPLACEAYQDYMRDAMHLSRMEVALLTALLHGNTTIESANPDDWGMSKREMSEFIEGFALSK